MTCYSALITPFDREGNLDEEGFAQNLLQQKTVDGLLVLGSTGESPTLTESEKKRVIAIARKHALPLMVGCGGYSTTQTIANIKQAADLGGDSALVVTPYYNKPTQEGLFQHFKTIAYNSPLPIIVYNIQGRTAVNILTDTLKRIVALPNITGIKEASGNMAQISEVIALKREFPHLQVFAGDDILTLPLMSLGGDGVISVVSNLVPTLMKKLVSACQAGKYSEAQMIHLQLLPMFQASGFETNPIPIKAAMAMAGFAAGDPRLPLTPLSSHFLANLKSIVEKIL